jgi:AAA domain/UvrD-like helicase C-terminal domain
MAGIADSSAEFTKKVLAQHHTAITLLGQLLVDPKANTIDWLDLGSGKGQILAQLHQNISDAGMRSKIGYYGYDLKNEHCQAVEKLAKGLGFRCVDVKTGEMTYFSAVFPIEQKFSFVSFTNTIHELHPRLIASLIIDIILRLAPNGILYIYDMEMLPEPELGAVPWDSEDLKRLLASIVEQLGCKTSPLNIQKWQHSSCPCWSVSFQRNHLEVSNDFIISKLGDILTTSAEVIDAILVNRLHKISEALEYLTKYGSDGDGNDKRIHLLHEFYSLTRVIIPRVVHLNESGFREAMLNLRTRGGIHQRAYDEAARIILSLNNGVDEVVKLARQTDPRINSCVKYSITSNHCLVAVPSTNFIYLLFVGTRDETERWLDRNRGLTISCNPETLKVTVTHVTQTEHRQIPGIDYRRLTEANQPYFERLPELDLDDLIPMSSLVRELKRIDDNTSDHAIQRLADELKAFDETKAKLILDLIFEMREGKLDAARARIEQFQEQAIPIQSDSNMEEAAIASTVNSDRATLLTGLSEGQLKSLFSPDKFQDWMLFLNPDQKRIAHTDYDRPAVLAGVSGSGKTCVVVHRAKYLAKKYPNERIGIITLNRNLSRMIQNLLVELCSDQECKNIEVLAVYDYFKTLVEYFGPEEYLNQLMVLAGDHEHNLAIKATIGRVDRSRFAREYDPVSSETIDDAWDIFLSQRHAKIELNAFADHLYLQQPTIDPDIYLREEFSLIRSALSTTSRVDDYLNMARDGRAIEFSKIIRRLTLKLLLLWEETMLQGGVLDDLSLTLALLPSRSKLQNLPKEMRFRSLLVDEFQDLSTLDLVLLRQIPTESENGFFVAGDTVQKVLVKSLKIRAVGLDIITQATWEIIKKNYRNSRQILKAASNLVYLYGKKAKMLGEEIEILDPEFAVRETGKPVAMQVAPEEELAVAWCLANECIQNQTAIPWSVCLVTACPQKITPRQILEAKPKDFPIMASQITGDYTRTKDTMCVGTVSDVKGFEFSMVIIVGCGADVLPNPVACVQESWREALRLYVAMTRARDSMILIYSGKPSEFLLTMEQDLHWITADSKGN